MDEHGRFIGYLFCYIPIFTYIFKLWFSMATLVYQRVEMCLDPFIII